MTKQEFLLNLQKALTNKVSAAQVAEYVNYYREYIEVEVRKGRAEEEVVKELGDPRLIAKSILSASGGPAGQYSQAGTGEGQEESVGEKIRKTMAKLPSWVWMVLVILAIIFIGIFLSSVIWALLPILLPLALVFFLVRWWNANK